MADKTLTPLFKQRSLVAWLLGFTVMYQMVYQVFIWRELDQEQAASDEWCASSPGAAPSSPRCLEAQLFRSWQQAAGVAPAWQGWGQDKMIGIEEMTTAPSTSAWNTSFAVPTASPSAQAPPASTTGIGPSVADGDGAIGASFTAAAEAPSSAGLLQEDEPAVVQSTSWSPMTAWARGLEALQRRMEARMWSLPSMQRKRRNELFENLDSIADNISASLASRSNNTYWGQELAQLQEHVEAHMAARRTRHASSKEAQHKEQKKKDDSLLQQITAFHKELCQEPFRVNYTACRAFLPARSANVDELQNRTAALEADLAAIATESSAWRQSFEARVAQTHKELCEEPQRRDRPDCVAFLADMKAQELRKAEALRDQRRARGAELRANITREMKEKNAALDAKLAELASEHRAWEKEWLEKNGLPLAVASENSPSESEGVAHEEAVAQPREPKVLHWSAVAAWASRPQRTQHLRAGGGRSGGELAVVGRAELRSSHWGGMIPKVACVTAISSGPAMKTLLKYFIQNFRLQTYEGPMQLVLVYHYKDLDAGQLVSGYADGFYIKGVAARSEGDFPSTTALRFGAWASDADVIVHWSFREWHDPQRLSLQVRALAYTLRPACVLRRRLGPETEREEDAWDATLAGEAAWMREHWHPLLAEQQAVLLGAEARHLVELDMDTFSGEHGLPAEELQ
mmetsp:Transcript_96444/g.241838  ORF Transcript_96444/g.241838 Transcript_96444/m.241838 type:complete len:688 (-) Transcript_96444:98-2161(-)|eukprot:CAMPEP_0115188014 /NCGR_PEP_ID=MMETSP0270-20121206/10788_1 /TAXON_ID=71861 /ORGANISM="Scrippsiella trochoidea, Strain CCMP3099" /LENGTH=687 /DNA_ID=CAMNT_0002601175 /DNA_START=56 /DNA_END=2119 /DNA_ORIENTATION=-